MLHAPSEVSPPDVPHSNTRLDYFGWILDIILTGSLLDDLNVNSIEYGWIFKLFTFFSYFILFYFIYLTLLTQFLSRASFL